MNKKQINNNNNDQVLDGYVIKLRLIIELHFYDNFRNSRALIG